MTRYRSIAVALSSLLLFACKLYDKVAVQELPLSTATTSRIKFHNFSPGSVGVNFFANDMKMTAISSTRCSPNTGAVVPADTAACHTTGIESTNGVAYKSLGSGGLYDAIAPGQYTLTAKLATDQTVVSTVTQAIEDGKYYSFFMSGVYNSTAKTAEAFVIEDPIPTGIDFSTAYVRLVNAVSNATGDLTLFVKPTGSTSAPVALGGAVAYKAAGTFMALPEGVYDLEARYTGAAGPVTGLTLTTQSFFGGRVYTITSLGNTASSTTMSLNNTANQQ